MTELVLGAAGAITTVMTTEMNSLANGALSAAGTTYDNSSAANRWVYASLELQVTFGVAPISLNPVNVFMEAALDGTNFTDIGPAGIGFAAHQVGIFPVNAVTSAQRLALWTFDFQKMFMLPACPIRFYVLNNAGQAMAATGNILRLLPWALNTR